MKPPKAIPDIDEAAKFFVVGLIVDGVPKSVTLSNDTILEYWPAKSGKAQHVLNLKIYGKSRGLGVRQSAIAQNALKDALIFLGGDGAFVDFGTAGQIYDEWKVHSFGFELP